MVNCSHHPSRVEIDNDITGIGVIIGYVATAGIVVTIILVHYFLSFQPRLDPFHKFPIDPALDIRQGANPVDQVILRPIRRVGMRLFGPRSVSLQTHSRLEQSLIKCMLSMSDIQIITGVSILVSGAAQLEQGLSCYQWQVVVYLAWFSSMTHLAGLTLLRNYLYHRPAERAWRLFSMLVLVVMLVFALVPTANYQWYTTERIEPALADYALCYLKPARRYDETFLNPFLEANQSATVAAILSILLVLIGFLSRVFKLHRNLALGVDRKLRGNLSHFLRNYLRKLYNWCDIDGSPRTLKRMFLYRPLIALFLAGRLFLDLWSSMFFEVLWLVVSFCWGVSQLFTTLNLYNGDENGEWSFGQVMSVALLAIPLVTMIELLYSDKDDKSNRDPSPDSSSLSIDGPASSLTLPGPPGQGLEHRAPSTQHGMIDHPDWESYYTSGSLNWPVSTMICGMATVIVFILVKGSVGGLSKVSIFQPNYYSWGIAPLVLVFCTWFSILFSLVISKCRDTFCGLARMLQVLLWIGLSWIPFVHYTDSRTTTRGYDLIGAVALYIIFALVYTLRGREGSR